MLLCCCVVGGKLWDEPASKTVRYIFSNMTRRLSAHFSEVIINADKDDNWTLDDNEIETLIENIEGIVGVEVADELLKKKIIENGRDLDSILMVIKGLLDDDPTTMVKF